jgi:hypothetical protein
MNHSHSRPCCRCTGCAPAAAATPPPLALDVSRRQFLYTVSALTAGGLALSTLEQKAFGQEGAPKRRPLTRRPLRVQPVLTYSIPQRREASSWREWGGIQTETDATAEKERIRDELARLSEKVDYPLEMLPLATARNLEQAAALAKGDHDVLVMYAAGGSGQLLETLATKDKWNLMFLRHDPGPVYLWYEIVHPRFLRKTVDDFGQPAFDVQDVVVDNPDELLWRLRALHGLKNALGKRIVAVGGPSGWGAGGQKAPKIAHDLWTMETPDYPYAQLGPRIKKALENEGVVKRCHALAADYLKQSGVSLQTTREFVNNAFVLCDVLKDIMDEADTDAITINSCMGTIMPMSQTTACLPLSLLNDDGYLAFCESDFVVIPAGILLHYISGKPMFLNDPTYPHNNVVTLAHCTAPRKMDGKNYEPAKILTHFESDYGAAPKVEMKIGQAVTNLVPDFDCKKWVGFDGTITGNPFLDICRSQVDVHINGDTTELLRQMKGFHWMTCYGSYLRETGYAIGKLGIEFLNLSAPKTA